MTSKRLTTPSMVCGLTTTGIYAHNAVVIKDGKETDLYLVYVQIGGGDTIVHVCQGDVRSNFETYTATFIKKGFDNRKEALEWIAKSGKDEEFKTPSGHSRAAREWLAKNGVV